MTATREEEEWLCDNCQKDTLHDCYYSNHERDSSGDLRTCKVCGWYCSGIDDIYYPPQRDTK